MVNAYVPNAQPELKRIDFRIRYEENIKKYLTKLNKKKSIIYCGDLNVAHNEIDLKNPDINHGNPGFSDEEREMMTKLLSKDFYYLMLLSFKINKKCFSPLYIFVF